MLYSYYEYTVEIKRKQYSKISDERIVRRTHLKNCQIIELTRVSQTVCTKKPLLKKTCKKPVFFFIIQMITRIGWFSQMKQK